MHIFLAFISLLAASERALQTLQFIIMAALAVTQAQVQRAAPVAQHRQRAAFRLQPCTLVQHRQPLPLRQPRQQFICRAASQQQQEQQAGLDFDRNDGSIIDVTPEGHVDVEVVSPAQQQEAETPAWWKFGQRLAKGAAVFALAMALVSKPSSLRFIHLVLHSPSIASAILPLAIANALIAAATQQFCCCRRLRRSVAAPGQPAAAVGWVAQASARPAAVPAASAAA